MPYFEVNGNKLYYEVKNPEAKETVAFFNGVMASVNGWLFQASLFEKLGYRVVLHDFKGQLMSDKPEGPYTFKEHAAEAKALFNHLKIKKIHIVGTSYGGEVAMRFALSYPRSVKSISVIDSVSELDSTLEQFIISWRRLAEKGDSEDFFWGMVPSIFGKSFLKKNKEFMQAKASSFFGLEEQMADYLKGQIALYDTFLKDVTMTKELKRIKCPSLIICGDEDILKPPYFSEIIANKIPNSEHFLIPDCGHAAFMEKPEQINTLLLGFISKNQ